MFSLCNEEKHTFGGDNRTRTYHQDPKLLRSKFRDKDGFKGQYQRKIASQNVRTFKEKFDCSPEPIKCKKRRQSKSGKSNNKRKMCQNI